MGLAGVAIYVLSLYLLENLYSRAAVGEYCAIIFFPMILVGMYEILMEKKENKRVLKPSVFARLELLVGLTLILGLDFLLFYGVRNEMTFGLGDCAAYRMCVIQVVTVVC